MLASNQIKTRNLFAQTYHIYVQQVVKQLIHRATHRTWPTRLKRTLTVTLKQYVKQVPGKDNDTALEHKHNFRNIVKKMELNV